MLSGGNGKLLQEILLHSAQTRFSVWLAHMQHLVQLRPQGAAETASHSRRALLFGV